MDKIKQGFVFIVLFLVFSGSMFCAGYYVGNHRGQVIIGEFENRLTILTDLNKQLQNENKQLADYNRAIRERLDEMSKRFERAKDIIAGFASQVSADGDTIQRALDTVERIERLLSVITE